MERGKAFFDERAAGWDEHRQTDERRLDFLLSLVPPAPGGRVLDVGTGTGVLLPGLLSFIGDSGSVDAVDFSSGMLAVALAKFKSAPNIRFIEGDILAVSLPEEAYDYIVSLNFFPHLTSLGDKQAYLKKAFGWLKNGGRLVVMHDISRERVNGIHEHKPETFDDRLPSARDTMTLFAQAGFTELFGIEDDFIYFVTGTKSK